MMKNLIGRTLLGEAISEVFSESKEGFQRRRENINLKRKKTEFRRACERADRLRDTNNRTYCVVQLKGRYKVLNRKQFLWYQRNRVFKKRVDWFKVKHLAGYIAEGKTNRKPERTGLLKSLMKWLGWM